MAPGCKHDCNRWTSNIQPPSREDYSGEVQYYEIFTENMEGMIYSAALQQCTLQVPAGLQAISISAATLYGMSPPATVSLRYSGTQTLPGPAERGEIQPVFSWSV